MMTIQRTTSKKGKPKKVPTCMAFTQEVREQIRTLGESLNKGPSQMGQILVEEALAARRLASSALNKACGE